MNKFYSYKPKFGFKDVHIVPCRNINNNNKINLHSHFDFDLLNKREIWRGIPIVSSSNVTSLRTFDVLKKENYLSCFPSYLNEYFLKEVPSQLFDTDYYMLSCGIDDSFLALELIQKLKINYDIHVKFLYVKVPNGYITELQDLTLSIREYYPDLIIIAGNVTTPDITHDLIRYSGVNIVNIGNIPGTHYPEVSAIIECAEAAHGAGGYLMSSNTTSIDDIPKSFVAGADFVCVESLFKDRQESPGDMCTLEGQELVLNNKGPIKNVVKNINKSLKNILNLTSSENLEEFYLNSQFIINN